MTRAQAKKGGLKINDFFTKSPNIVVAAPTSKRKRAVSEESEASVEVPPRKTSRVTTSTSKAHHVPIAWVQLPTYDNTFLAAYEAEAHEPEIEDGRKNRHTTRQDRKAPQRHTPDRVDLSVLSLKEPTPPPPPPPPEDGQRRSRRTSRKQIRYSEILLGDDDDEDENEEKIIAPRKIAKADAQCRHDSDFEGHSETEDDDDAQSSDVISEAESTPQTSEVPSEDETASKSKPKSKAKPKSASGESSTRTDRSTSRMNNLFTKPRGLDLSLPPLHRIEDIFADITEKAITEGYQKAVDDLQVRKRPFRVATMCSGTESPLLALRMIQKCLAATGRKVDETMIEHVFSAEIVPYKQAYIERNFAPNIIFRDITELTTALEHPEPVATTVYGAKVPVPKDIDFVIAGTSCVDFSRLNNHQKGLDGGESGDTWNAVLAFCRVFQPAIVLLENVKGAQWNVMLGDYEEIGYESIGAYVNSKDYYLPQTRQRGYMACFNQSLMAAGGKTSEVGARWLHLMAKFQRFASAPASSFLQSSSEGEVILDEPNTKEVDWEKCAVRQMAYRQDMKLGNARPITHWQESNTMLPPENSSRAWFKRQVQRVLDTIDCAHIRNALPDNGAYDSHFKTRIWDLSQNVDREKDSRQFGIVGCITPSGIFFVSDAGRALTAEELLSLQGIPLDEISFTTESPKEIQDLAGNAMSTPVVGCAIAAALIAASGTGLLGDYRTDEECVASSTNVTRKAKIVINKAEAQSFKSSEAEFDLNRILCGAAEASRMCYCEGAKGTAKASIQKCADCDHTTCTACGGNPMHNYQAHSFVQRKSATQFEDELRALLPLRLKFKPEKVVDSLRPHHEQAYLNIVSAALVNDFWFDSVQRTYCWKATYVNRDSRLDFVIDGQQAEWWLYVNAPVNLSSKDKLRKWFDLPIARSQVLNSPLGDDWQWRLPNRTSTKATVTSSGKHVSSWWNRLGMPEFQGHDVPDRLSIVCQPGLLAEAVNGTYQYLPNCGKASNSLFKRISSENDGGDERPLFLFLDPTRVGDPIKDSFVFSHNMARLDYSEVRDVVASIDYAWRPWPYKQSAALVDIGTDHTWVSLDCGPATHDVQLEMKLYKSDDLNNLLQNTTCTEAIMVGSCSLPYVIDDQTVSPDDDKFFASQNGIFEALRRNLSGSQWTPLCFVDGVDTACQHGCAPDTPETRWRLNADEKLTPYDDPASAGIYERAIKARILPIFVEIRDSTLGLCVNPATLAHRAAARLIPTAADVRFQWRLVVDAQEIGGYTTRKPFQIQATTGIAPFAGSVGAVELFPKQRLALAWMKAQEAGTDFVLEEVADAEIPALGWRSEVRAECSVRIRGGICADHPGFGKTITSLALIESQYIDVGRLAIEADIVSHQQGTAAGLLPTAATLIVSPPHLVQQWETEIKEKLGSSKNIIAIKTVKDLDKYAIADFKQAKIIVVNRKLFANDSYLARLAALAAIPAPITNSGRSFQKWMQYASEQIPKHLSVFKTHGATGLKEEVKTRFQDNIDSEIFQAAIPSRRLKGKAYAERAKGKPQKAVSSYSATIDPSSVGRPLFEMFYFNRLIVDEFHESDVKEMAHIVRLQADKRWGLSATPAMDDAYDVAQIARLLGISLRTGSSARGIMKKRNRDELKKDMTDFQLFDMMRHSPSDVQQSRVYEHAQKFLDVFVRQNVMDFDIPFKECLVPVVLDSSHRALYTELSQHLNSLDMQIKKVKVSKTGTQLERQKALMEDFSLSSTAEGVLSCKAAYSDATGLAEIIKRRENEVKTFLDEIPAVMRLAHSKEKGYFIKWLADIRGGSLGDAEATSQIIELAPAQAKADSKVTAVKRGQKANSDEMDDLGTGRVHTAKLNTLCKNLLISKRSERFVSNVKVIQEAPLEGKAQLCDSTECQRLLASNDRAVSAFCGHVICRSCFGHQEQSLSTACPAKGCSSSLYDYHLLWAQKMGGVETARKKHGGAKLGAAMDLLKEIGAKCEQAIVFVQFSNQLSEVEAALTAEGIPALVVHSDSEFQKIEEFKTSSSDTAVALVLNTADRTASGSNLQNANHVIFLSPLLKSSQYDYAATMAQAIGRVRRHGQKRDVQVHRLVALDTIDVDILEHRERRITALAEREQSLDKTQTIGRSSDPEKTQLIRDDKGRFSLQPHSWLTGSRNGQGALTPNGKGRVPGFEDFSSLVKFSGAYAEGDE
jgi:site-specific DNA-cytosine methylase/superfamily II DNA or RNA helicase